MTSLLLPDTMKKTCRTCLSTNGEMVSIFSCDFYVKQLPKKLMAFTNVEISENDGLPKVICKKCVFLADSFYCFKEQCEFAYYQLKSFMRRASNLDDRLKANDDGLKIDANNPIPQSNGAQDSVPENEADYVVEYISEDVKIKVEEALKRRQEAERRINIAKVSQSIRNLKGIEVVPISDVCAARKAKITGKTKNQEIVMFPVRIKKKKKKTTAGTFEIITIDDTQPIDKKLELTHDTSSSEIPGQKVEGEESMVYSKQKKLNFSTVRKVVKIDVKEGLHIEPKDEDRKTLNAIQTFQETSNEVILGDDQNTEDNIEHLNHEKLDHKVEHTDHERKKSQFSHLNQMLDQEKIEFRNEKKENIDVSVKGFEDTEDPAVIMEKSTVGCIINAINNKSFKDMNYAGEDIMMSFENAEDKAQADINYVMDESSEDLTKSRARDNSEDEKLKSIQLPPPSCSKLDACKIDDDDEVKPLALLSVDPSKEEDKTTTSIKIYQREDFEPPENVAKEISAVTDQYSIPPFSSPNQKGNNRNLRFYQCTICSMNFVSMPAVLKHNIEEHMIDQSPFFCLICDKTFENKHSLSNHVDEHNGSKPYKCTFCPKTFTLQRNLKRHVNHHINYKPYQCEICTKKFTEKSSLKSHMFLHTGESPFACKSCNVSFNNKTNWRRHVVTIHEKLTAVVCTFCNKELPNRRSLRVHLRVHTGDRPYQCPHCDKRFTQQCNLNTHIHCHLNDRPFTCSHCGKGFNQRGTRDDHVLTHTGERRHKCTKCEASFTVSSALKRHLWVHTEKSRPYNCDRCKLQFVGLYDLRRHLRVRHGQLIKPGNPRVARVVVESRKKKRQHEDVPVEPTEVDRNETRIPMDCFGLESTSKENNFLSCNVTKLENGEPEITRQSLSETKIENFTNGTKKEIIYSPDISSDKDDNGLKIKNGDGEKY